MRSSYTLILCVTLIINSNQEHLPKHDKDFSGNATIPKHRVKRNLIFQPGTRIMFRANTKDNIIKVNQIFAHGFGFRANIDLTQPDKPSLLPRVRRSLSRSDVFEALEELVNQYGFNGKSCISKMICDAQVREINTYEGIFIKLLRLILRSHRLEKEADESLTLNDCRKLHNECPLNQLKISPFTDL